MRKIYSKSAIECFPVDEETASDLDELKETFDYESDLRAAIEDRLHIYDDYAEMSEEEFEDSFKKFVE